MNEVALRCEGLTKSFGANSALAGVDLSVHHGEIRGLVGSNGSGKSTLLRCILGLLRHDSGRLELLGRPVDRPRPGPGLAGVAGLVEGARWPRNLTVGSALSMATSYDGGKDVDVSELSGAMGLAALRRTRIAELSMGGRQRLGIATALMRGHRLLLLDEPVNGLDAAGRAELRRRLRDLAGAGAAVIIASHDPVEVALTCDSVSEISHGRVHGSSAPSHPPRLGTVTVQTADDEAALAVLESLPGLSVSRGEGELVVIGDVAAVGRASVAIGSAGIAIQRWQPRDDSRDPIHGTTDRERP